MSSNTHSTSSNDVYSLSPCNPDHFSSERICPIFHSYEHHPLLQIDSLKSLASRLYKTEQCRFVNPGMSLDSDFWHESNPTDGKDLHTFFENIAESGSWIALYNVEADPEYKKLVEDIVHSRRDLIEPEQGRILESQGFIFISAPPSITPFHIDRENNFWLQIKGTKEMTVFDRTDREVISEPAIEDFIVNRTQRRVVYSDEIAVKGNRFITKPGDGVYFPSTSPHMTRTTTDWVTDDENLSISIGVVFYTEKTLNDARIYQFNRLIRKLGLSPNPPGSSSIGDRVKSMLGHHWSLLRMKYKSYSPPPHSF